MRITQKQGEPVRGDKAQPKQAGSSGGSGGSAVKLGQKHGIPVGGSRPSIPVSSPDPVKKHPISIKPKQWPKAAKLHGEW